jgi:hypothetical protein
LSNEHNEFSWVLVSELEKYGDSLEPEIKKAIILAAS